MDLINKRLFKELNDLLSDNAEINIKMTKLKTRFIIGNITFSVSSKYPFEKPEIFIRDNIIYSDWLVSSSSRICKLVAEKGFKCLCCNTILCDWTPSYTINRLLDEIKYMNSIKREVKYRILLYDILLQKTKVEPNFIIHHIMAFL
jgi:ubiquitin-protein ligase